MKAGAVDFLTKPFRSQDLLDAVFAALDRDKIRRKMQQWQSILREHYESLSARERDVITMVVAGKLNKQIAADLEGVKLHRANSMRKMRATSLAHLIRHFQLLGLNCDPRSHRTTLTSSVASQFARFGSNPTKDVASS